MLAATEEDIDRRETKVPYPRAGYGTVSSVIEMADRSLLLLAGPMVAQRLIPSSVELGDDPRLPGLVRRHRLQDHGLASVFRYPILEPAVCLPCGLSVGQETDATSTDLTIFAANYLVFIERRVAAALILVLLYRAPRTRIVNWALAGGVMVIVAYLAAQIGGAAYNDPRPFVAGHFHPLIAHVADNGFPSDHALMAAALLAAVALARVRWAIVVLPLAVLVEWARVGAGLHHPIDVLGSDLCVAVGVLAAMLIAPALTRIVLPFVPGRVLDLVAAPEQKIA